ncbi:MAG: hypothetical protein ISR65_09080 [Bacteriovoracaceae bacterium]|nr:hypothetical protein [Bacteriovoracaceae bacterium]
MSDESDNRAAVLKSLIITVFLYGIYQAGHFFSIVAILGNSTTLLDVFMRKQGSTSFFALGFMPALTGYFVIEIVFVMIPPLKKIRNNKLSGRKIINKGSQGVSFIMATYLAWNLVRILQVARDVTGELVLVNQSFMILILHALFFVAGFGVLLLIGNLISRFGVGNGFCIMIAMGGIVELVKNFTRYFKYVNINNLRLNYIGIAIFVGFLFLIFNLIKNKDWNINILDKKKFA